MISVLIHVVVCILLTLNIYHTSLRCGTTAPSMCCNWVGGGCMVMVISLLKGAHFTALCDSPFFTTVVWLVGVVEGDSVAW